MIEPDKRKAIFLLHQEGMSARQIAQQLRVSRPTVKTIIAQEGQNPEVARTPKQPIDPELLQRLYNECEGWIQRVHERLAEEEKIQIKYSSLTWKLRQLGISKPK